MKKIIALFIFLCTTFIIGRASNIVREVEFDFTQPDKLNPAIDLSVFDETDEIYLEDKIFKSGDISVSFGRKVGDLFLRPGLRKDSKTSTYTILLHRGSYMTISGNNALIKTIKLSGDNTNFSSMQLDESTKGELMLGSYDCKGEDISFVKVNAEGASAGKFSKITVTFEIPMDQLEVSSVLPTPEEEILATEFNTKGATLLFNEAISIADNAVFSFTKEGTTETISAKATANGTTVTVKPTTSLEAGNYTLSVSEGAIVAEDGMYNKAFTSTFSLVAPQNTFNPENVPGGNVDEIPNVMELVFPAVIGNTGKNDDAKDISKLTVPVINAKTNEEVAIVSFNINPDNTKTLVMSLTPGNAITATGIYTITIPEQSIYNLYYGLGAEKGELWNSEIKMEFRVGDLYIISDELKNKVETLLAKSGIGYPKEDAEERTTLQSLLDKAVKNQEGADDEINAAINAYIATDNIEFPTTDKYYTIANVSLNGKKHYLAYSEGKVTLTADAAEAYSFLSVAEENATIAEKEKVTSKMYFKTLDGMYLHTLVTNNDYDGVTSSNVTAEKKDVNLLTLEKLSVGDKEATFGLIAMSGKLDKNTTAYSTVRPDGTIKDECDEQEFTEKFSSAFVFAEAEAPVPPAPADPETTYTLNPASGETVETLSEIILTIENVSNIAWNSESTITLASEEQTLTLTEVAIDAESSNVARISVSPLDNGTYTLSIPEGTFTYEYEGRQINVPAISATYIINSTDIFNYDFIQKYSLYSSISMDGVYSYQDINNMRYWTKDTEIHINENVDSMLYLIDQNDLYDKETLVQKYVAIGKFSVRKSSETFTETIFYRNGERIGRVSEYISENKVKVYKDGQSFTTTYIIGTKDEIREEERIENTYYLDVVWNKELNEKTLHDSRYGIIRGKGCFGDTNYGRYLQGDKSIKKSDCHLCDKDNGTYFDIKNSTSTVGISGIENIENGEEVIYDLSGRRMKSTSQPGIYIKNGKKVVVR